MKNFNDELSWAEWSNPTSLQYSMTITSLSSHFDTCDLELLNKDCTSVESLLSIQELPVVVIDTWGVKRKYNSIYNSIESLTKEVEGCICLCDFQAVNDIDVVIKIAAISGARAVLISKPCSNWKASLPIFLIPTDTMQNIASMYSVTVQFQVYDNDTDNAVMKNNKLSSERMNENKDCSKFNSAENLSTYFNFSDTTNGGINESLTNAIFDHHQVREGKSSLSWSRPDTDPLNSMYRKNEIDDTFNDKINSKITYKTKLMSRTDSSGVSSNKADIKLNKNEMDYLGEEDYSRLAAQNDLSWTTVTCFEADINFGSFCHTFYSDMANSQKVSLKKDYSIVCIDPQLNGKFHEKVKDCVCVFRLTEMADIEKAQSIACRKGAAALFFLSQSSSHCAIPVFVISNQLAELLWELKKPTVVFDIQISHTVYPPKADSLYGVEAIENDCTEPSCVKTSKQDQCWTAITCFETHDTGSSTFHRTFYCEGMTSKNLSLNKAYEIICVDPYRSVVDERIKDLLCLVRDRVCVFRLTKLNEINKAQSIAFKKGAKALFFLEPPSSFCDIPVFVISKELTNCLWSLKKPAVSFDIHTLPGTKSSEEDSLSQFNTSESSNIKTASHTGTGLLKQGFYSLKNLVLGKEHVLKQEKIDDLVSNQDAYIKTIRKIKSASFSTEFHELADDIKKFFKKNNPCIGQIVAVAYLWDCTINSADKRDLSSLILNWICTDKTSDSSVCLEFLKPGSRLFPKPHGILFKFLSNNLDMWSVECATDPLKKETWQWKTLALLEHCGLFRKQFDRQFWLNVQNCCCAKILFRNHKHIGQFIGPDRSILLILAVQPSVDDFLSVFLHFDVEKEIKLISYFHHLILFRIDQHWKRDESLLLLWKSCLELISRANFGGNTDEIQHKIMRHILTIASFGKQRTFSKLSDIVMETSSRHGCLKDVRRIAMDVISEDCKDAYLTLENVNELLSSELAAESVNCSTFRVALYRLVGRTTQQWSSFEDKLVLLDLVYRKYLGGQIVDGADYLMKSFKDHLQTVLREENSSVPVVFMSLKLAASKPCLFVLPGGKASLVDIVVASIANLSAIKAILQSPDCLINLEINVDNTAVFFNALQKELKALICNVKVSIIEAADFYHNTFLPDNFRENVFAQQLGEILFTSCFFSWSPSQISDITQDHKIVIDVLYRGDSRNLLTGAGDNAKKFQSCKQDFEAAISRWISSFEAENMTKAQLESLLKTSSGSVWQSYEKYHRISFPTKNQVQEKLNQLSSILNQIKTYLTVNVDGYSLFLHEILAEYDCSPSDELKCFISDYHNRTSSVADSQPEDYKSLKEMRRDCEKLHDHSALYDDVYKGCAYFSQKYSALFRKIMRQVDNRSHTLDTLKERFYGAINWLKNVFGRETSSYEQVAEALKIIRLSNTSSGIDVLEKEIKSLLEFPVIRIFEQEDANTFNLVTLLYDLSEPLRGLISFCDKSMVFMSGNCPIYADLKRNVDSFYSRDNDIASCLSFIKQLQIVFGQSSSLPEQLQAGFSPNAVSVVSWPESKHALYCSMPLINLLGNFSRYPDLWHYFDSMGWMGEDGLKQFYVEYGNVTNVLLGDTTSYEMSLLDSMVPVLRAMSAIGGFRQCASFDSFLEKMKRSEDVKLSLNPDFEDNLHQVFSRLSEIIDWFSNGLDEAATIKSLFISAEESGFYSLSKCSNSVVAKLGQTYYLTLEFTVKKDEKIETKTYSGSDLTQFIHQLSLALHEKNSDEIQAFVDQYQILSRVFQNFLMIESCGYENMSFSDFRCRCGHDFLGEAKQLLRQSEIRLSNFSTWLRNTRDMYKASLFFWTEELRAINYLLNSICSGEIESSVLLPKVKRLQMGKQNLEDIKPLLDRCIDGFQLQKSKSWLVEVSRFITAISDDLISFNRGKHKMSTIILHTIHCDDKEMIPASLHILQDIFKQRLPNCVEMLDGSLPISSDRMDVFLARVRAFPDLTFVVCHADRLQSSVLEKLRFMISNRDIGSEGVSLHVIQQGESLISTNPWVCAKNWDSQDISAERIEELGSTWRQLVSHEQNFRNIKVIWSPKCGSGKTRFIREELKALKVRFPSLQVITLAIHEKTSCNSLIQSLNNKGFGIPNKERALYCSFSFLPCTTNLHEYKQWLSDLNHFFFSLLVLRLVQSPDSSDSFCFTGNWTIFVELPETPETGPAWLSRNIPIISGCCQYQNPTTQTIVDEKTRRVCTYLRAFENGTINRKFESTASKRILLALDCSGSMCGQPFQDACQNALSIFDSHVVEGDEFCLILFDHNVYTPIPLQSIAANINVVRKKLLNLQFYSGGTSMYRALRTAMTLASQRDGSMETWIISLTDGISDNKEFNEFRQDLVQSPHCLHMVIVGINLHPDYEQHVQTLCNKYNQNVSDSKNKGFFVRADDSSTESIDAAFSVVKSRIPVSKTFELDGKLTDQDCHDYIRRFLPSFVNSDDKLLVSFWINFIYRRVKVFDKNESFNYNVNHDQLGSSLMEVMLAEAERLLDVNYNRELRSKNYSQLIYDFTIPESPEFRLLCTAPEKMDPEEKKRLSELDLPGFRIPTRAELEDMSVLVLSLSQAFGIPMETRKDGTKFLSCIEENNFILTNDFGMKLLNIHERVACRVPCLLEGETGVSKTAITKMFSILRNQALKSRKEAETITDLEEIEVELQNVGFFHGYSSLSVIERMHDVVKNNDETCAERLLELIQIKAMNRSSVYASLPPMIENSLDIKKEAIEKLNIFANSVLETTFFEVNVDSSLTESYFISVFNEIQENAKRIDASGATIVVFLDEINTSSVLGLLKEIVVDHSIAGEKLEDNIVVVAALNPPRSQIQVMTRERDLGRDWASGHYQVAALPPSMNQIKWSFHALTPSQEKDFIHRRIQSLRYGKMPSFLQVSLTEVVSESHEMMRDFAYQNILSMLRRCNETDLADDQLQLEARLRACSVVSLRDIQRVFRLFGFFSQENKTQEFDEGAEGHRSADKLRRAMLLSIAVVYYLRLDSSSRNNFLSMIGNLPTEKNEMVGLLDVLEEYMEEIIQATEIPSGIAVTRGLKENIFVTVVCTLSKTPLVIVGPPGSSKTLAVNIVGDNACGIDSLSTFYRSRPRLSLFHYQCSKQSTSREIAAVFEQAIQRQQRVNEEKQRCIVFMDEAGLPEEEKESLKVLHYLLEGHMSAEVKVGFVAISNHVLDAAKSNRCIMLLREEPDDEEMLNIANGVLFDLRQDGLCSAQDVVLEGSILPIQEFSRQMCQSYGGLFKDNSPLQGLNTFFGLRDFIYFLKSVRYKSKVKSMRFHTSLSIIIQSIERNFNGVTHPDLRQICAFFLNSLGSIRGKIQTRRLVDVLKEALLPSSYICQQNRPRFKLIIDCSEDDSILRLLSICHLVEITQPSIMFKLSQMPENMHLEQLRLVSGVKFAASQGNFVILSQTEPINESFYDLFNQRFRAITNNNGKQMLFANIAVGGISRRSQVRPEFECIVHVRESKIPETPAPFLNRFEKYRLTLQEILTGGWSHIKFMQNIIARAQKRTNEITKMFNSNFSGFGWTQNEQTRQSIFINCLPSCSQQPEHIFLGCEDNICISDMLINFFQCYTSLGDDVRPHIESVLMTTKIVFPYTIEGTLKDIVRSIFEGELAQGDNKGKDVEYVLAIVEMTITRYAVFRLLQLATPESIFANRHVLPDDIVQEYFLQEHFSIRLLLKKYSLNCRLLVIHTRSDQFIHSIPSVSTDENFSRNMNDSYEFVYDNPHTVVVEHLSRLQNETTLRRIVKAWIGHGTKNQFLLLVDMSRENSVDQVNFVRTMVEQEMDQTSPKSFVLILHYSPSNVLRSQCYPALFLGGWQHVFLDGVGNETAAIGVDHFIARACSNGEVPSTGKEIWERNAVESLFSRTLPYIANQMFLYSNQFENWENFSNRKAFLEKLLLVHVGDKTIGEIICEKFLSVWTNKILIRTTQRASDALLQGTTKLSLTLSISSVFIQSFQAFFASLLVDMNQWKNLDLIMSSLHSEEVSALFGLVLKKLPLIPYEELILLRKQNSSVRLFSLPATKTGSATVAFPFFFFVSNFLDELVENVVENILRRNNSPLLDEFGVACELSARECFHMVEKELWSGNEISNNDEGRYNAVKSVINFVMDRSTHQDDKSSLFSRYLQQYIEWKIGCTAHPFICDLLRKQVEVLSSQENILAVHVVAATDPWVGKVASLVDCAELLPLFSQESFQSFKLNSFDYIVQACFEFFRNDNKINPVQKKALLLATSFLRDIEREDDSLEVTEQKRRQLRRLELLMTLNSLNIFSNSSLRETFDWLFANEAEEHDYSLSRLLNAAKSLHPESEENLMEAICLFLVGPLADENDFADDDVDTILDNFLHEHASIQQKQLAAALLSHTTIFGTDKYKNEINEGFLMKINDKVTCLGVALFSADGRRCSIPHYIPDWLRSNDNGVVEMQKQDLSTLETSLQIFFSDFKHSFEGEFSHALFEVLLSSMNADSATSEQIFLHISREIESESSVDQKTFTKLSRHRSSMASNNLRGSAVSALVLSARVLCFVTKIAQEIAMENRAIVLSGTYASEAAIFLDMLMQQGYVRWQYLFVNTIIRIRGQGTFASALRADGPLNKLTWCQQWIDALPTSMEGTLRSLHNAETVLAEAEREETKKSNEFRVCPHCGNIFGIDQRNCGSFVCGRDYHVTGSTGGHGCGQGFNIDTAAPYTINEERLHPLRERVAMERVKLSRCRERKELFDKALALTVPVYLVSAVHENVNECALPAASLIPCRTEQETDTSRLIKIMWDASALVSRLKLLPDFIEFYLWIHETFQFLVTRDIASTTTVEELMNKERLQERFDVAKTHHLLSLWYRVCDGLNAILRSDDGKLRWECQEIIFPFPNIESATLASLMSDGPHPTDGNDYLFIVINDIIESYNSFVARISPFFMSDVDQSSISDVILPTFIKRGYGGALALSTAAPFSEDELNFVVKISWNQESKSFDHDKILQIVKERIALGKQPASIGNPIDTLRQRFYYRENGSCLSDEGCRDSLITKVDCHYFANQQDAHLVGEIRDLLKELDPIMVDLSIEGILIDHFHSINYTTLRELVEGCRNLLDLMVSYSISSFETIESCLEDVVFSVEKETDMLSMVGFPILTNAQRKFLLTLNFSEFSILMTFLAYQLASEAYSFASLPLHMSDSLPSSTAEKITTSLDCKRNDNNELEKAVKDIEEFDRDILSFYESQIRDAAAKASKSLKLFLSEKNFCDSSDAVFTILPSSVSLRHYVSLRQLLQQSRLSFLYRMREDKAQNQSAEINFGKYKSIRKGFCWMWENDEELTKVDASLSEAAKNKTEQNQWKLWFERALSDNDLLNSEDTDEGRVAGELDVKDTDETMVDSCSFDVIDFIEDECGKNTQSTTNQDSCITLEDRAAYTLQRWWRCELEILKADNLDFCNALDDNCGNFIENNDLALRHNSSSKQCGKIAEKNPNATEETFSGSSSLSYERQSEQKSLTVSDDAIQVIYGTRSDELEMRKWLDKNSLPQTVAETLLALGARCIEDVKMLVLECPELLSNLPPLDRMKLKKIASTAVVQEREKVD